MRLIKKEIFFLLNFLILLNSFNSFSLGQTKQSSIIKLFCLQSVKQEMLKAELAYSEEIANETCECYYEEFTLTSSHEDAKKNCRLKAKDKFKS
tara:strand:+ start:357 stop:638 length:282 start_codon:yes stop_codon:yes gene_type:complete